VNSDDLLVLIVKSPVIRIGTGDAPSPFWPVRTGRHLINASVFAVQGGTANTYHQVL